MKKDLAIFLGLAFAISWLASLPFVLNDSRSWSGTYYPLAVTAKFGPSLAAVLIAHFYLGNEVLFDLLRRLLPSVRHLGLTLLALVAPPLIAFSTVALAPAAGDLESEFQNLTGGLVAGAFLGKFFMGGGLGEELGWRGFALPRMQKLWRPLTATLILGGFWTLWHLPAWFIAGSDQGDTPWYQFLILVLSFSVLLTWLYNRTQGNLLVCVMFHASVNATEIMLEAAFPRLNLNSPVHWWIAGTYVVLALGVLGFTRGRLGYRPAEASSSAPDLPEAG